MAIPEVGGRKTERCDIWITALLCAAAAACVYVLTAGPTVYWLDSSEFVAAAWSLGVAHPPGHPLAALVHRLMCYLPVGTIAFRVGLASAALSAAAVAFVAGIARELIERVHEGAPGHASASTQWPTWVACGLAALAGGLGYGVWFQALRAEVYALNLMLLAAAIYLALRWQRTTDRRYAVGAGLLVGLALCNHHLLVLLALPGGVLLLAWTREASPQRWRTWVGVALAALLGLSVLLYLPLRSAADPVVNWGAPHTLQRLAWVVSAKAFQQGSAERAARQTLQQRSKGAIYAVMGGPPTSSGPMAAGALITLLGVGGLYLAARRRRSRSAATGLGVIIAFNLGGPVLVGFDPYNPDAHGYLALAGLLLTVGLAVVLHDVLMRLVTARKTVGIAAMLLIVVAFPVVQLLVNWPRVDLRRHWAAEETGRAILDQPPGTLLLSSYFQTAFNVWALQTAADLRPDVQLFHRNFLAQPAYAQQWARRAPALSAEVQRWHNAGDVKPSDLDSLAGSRHVVMEYDLNVKPDIAAHLSPVGLTLTYQPALPVGVDMRRHAHRVQRWLQRVGRVDELETRRALTWTHFLLARHACALGHRGIARFHLSHALALAPRSREVNRLATHCVGRSASQGRTRADGFPKRSLF